ncbi:transglycosylase domain-containing protein [Peptoniphilus catoniae]|uniref:transglycosylase domain-containing protein n=1 Tax=Peptoniphilus catoniae TaxID=1660341 RepID=UPI0010FDF9A9|nr:transglycosylase domain-containing protein [Peptoniphilus catoniae]
MNRNKKRGRRKFLRLSSFFKILLILALSALITLGTFVSTSMLSILKKAPRIDAENYRALIHETSSVYDDKENLIQTLVLNEFSQYVTLDKIPKNLKNAVIAIEDERFYQHDAVDFKRILGALVSNLKAGRIVQGGSTISMQLAKNLYTSSNQSIERKLTDIYYAYEMESKLSKDQILEAYMNSAGFSKGTVGVQAAAKTFFNKNVSDLSLAECALVAGITNRPEKYSPYIREAITGEDNIESIQFELVPTSGESPSEETLAISSKLKELGRIDSFDLKLVESGTLVPMKAVFNEKSKERQKLILKKMKEQNYISNEEYEAALIEPINIVLSPREEKGLSSFFVDEVKEEAISILESLGYSNEEANTKLYTGGFQIYSSMSLDLQKHMEEVVNNDKLFPRSRTDENGIKQPQVGAVLMDPHTGQVKALIGGRGIAGNSNFNRATSPRSPGSSIKPISVYMTAFRNGATAADVYLDAPLPKSIFKYTPTNVGSYVGWTNIRNLIVRSSNVGAYLVARDIGVDYNMASNKNYPYSKAVDEPKAMKMIMENLEDIGVTSLVWPEDNPVTNDQIPSSMALGGMTKGISPLEMAGAYTPLANEGVYQKPSFIDKITNSSGEVIYERSGKGKKILSPQNAFILTNILEDVVKKGTGTNANFPKMSIAGKTGTTNQKKEAWFVGYTPYYLCSVFIGNDLHEPMPFMSSVAASLWKEFMKPIHKDLEDKEFPQPETGLYRKYVGGRYEYFVEGTKPHYLNKYSFVESKDDDEDNNNKNNNNSKKSSSKKKSKSTDNNNNAPKTKKKKKSSNENN